MFILRVFSLLTNVLPTLVIWCLIKIKRRHFGCDSYGLGQQYWWFYIKYCRSKTRLSWNGDCCMFRRSIAQYPWQFLLNITIILYWWLSLTWLADLLLGLGLSSINFTLKNNAALVVGHLNWSQLIHSESSWSIVNQ